VTSLAARDAYRLWAPSYAAETAISRLDEELAQVLSPPTAGRRLLDAGCGIGRRLPGNAALAIGIDVSAEMLAAGGARPVAVADVRNLPFAGGEFDLIWCRLVLGHLAEPGPAYRELARVCRSGGHLLVSDFHPDAVRAGHQRSFRASDGRLHAVEHHVHEHLQHIAMAEGAGFELLDSRDGAIGPSVVEFYRGAGRGAQYQCDKGLAVVAAFLFRRR
jgi:SAM-dependent methyltransferase